MSRTPWPEPSEDAMTGVVDAIAGLPIDEQRAVWDSIKDQLEARADFDAAQADANGDRRSQAGMAVKSMPPPVVYYVRFGDRVKIGYTTNLRQRLAAIPHDELMATEPGGTDVEAQRHAQFAGIRVTGEWFQLTESLAEHIASL